MLDEKNCNFFKQTGETANYRENSEPFPCLYHIPRFSTAFSVKLIRLSAKTATESPPPFFPLIYTSFYPIEPKCSLTSFPQCWHLISRTVLSVSVPSSSKMHLLHLRLGHLITSICHRLLYSTPASNRPYFPPPRTDM